MRSTIDGNPDYGEVRFDLDPGDVVRAASGAMNWYQGDLELRGRLLGGVVRSVARKLLGGTSMFITEYTAGAPGAVGIAPTFPGAVTSARLDDGKLFLSPSTFLAATDGIDLRTRFYGSRGFLSGSGPFLIEASGSGEVWFSAFGGLVERELDGDLLVDTGHVCAFEPTVGYRLRGAGGVKQTLFSGEGLLLGFSGRGRIYLQSRNASALAQWVTPFLRG